MSEQSEKKEDKSAMALLVLNGHFRDKGYRNVKARISIDPWLPGTASVSVLADKSPYFMRLPMELLDGKHPEKLKRAIAMNLAFEREIADAATEGSSPATKATEGREVDYKELYRRALCSLNDEIDRLSRGIRDDLEDISESRRTAAGLRVIQRATLRRAHNLMLDMREAAEKQEELPDWALSDY